MRVPLIADGEVEEGRVAEVDFFGRPVLVLRAAGRVRAYVNICTHLGGPLALAADGERFECQWHGACFDARTGAATGAPARPGTRLIRLPVTVEAGQVTYVYGEPDRPAEAQD
jgi:3-phenylpropionate/trans-cinnamate dioxygenase ferredoxin subunit